ncbi:GCN5-related N-acetyl-transferase-domain-containing protein [Gilbertella persicaria]|nr:GCN5-related N-acetyl-transferase-domain-containing protein [Gilbertella persicaria]KAI8074295.1 GCN5-related N-acetyl-transferase-domain-containing protein [Gilbertella persicaria]
MTNSHPLPSPPDFKMSGYGNIEYIQSQRLKDKEEKKEDNLSIPLSPQTPPLQPIDALPQLSSILSPTQFHAFDIVHDSNYCMFKIKLDTEGNTAALCYLPTRYKNIIEFYHIEIPVAYRQQGLGDLLLYKAFQWVEKSNLLVIPTCPFVRKYLETRFPDQKSGNWSYIVLSEPSPKSFTKSLSSAS